MKNSLSTRALLVSVNISQWSGRRLDKVATATANSHHKASRGAGNYTKKLLPNARELDAIFTIASKARQYFYEQSLPWMADGTRILSSENYLDFTNSMRKIKAEFDNAVADFVTAYPKLKANAQSMLGDLFNEGEYPNIDELKSKFSIETSFLPMPDVKDFRVELAEVEKKEFVKKMREVESIAMRDCWDRLHSVVKVAADKLSQPDALFRDSLIENITEIVNLLPKLNITNDTNLETARRDVENLVLKMRPDVLRVNVSERDKASKELAEIENKMKSIMGGI